LGLPDNTKLLFQFGKVLLRKIIFRACLIKKFLLEKGGNFVDMILFFKNTQPNRSNTSGPNLWTDLAAHRSQSIDMLKEGKL
jgi:hypothetical protein